jgi:hypothetical protein
MIEGKKTIRWTKEHEKILIDLYENLSDTKISEYFINLGFKRSAKIIWKKRKRMGLNRSQKSLSLIRENNIKNGSYKCKHSPEVLKDLAKKRGEHLKKVYANERRRLAIGLPLQTKLLTRKGGRPKRLSECDVYEIITSKERVVDLAKRLNTSTDIVYLIKQGKIYKTEVSNIKSRNRNPCEASQINFQ